MYLHFTRVSDWTDIVSVFTLVVGQCELYFIVQWFLPVYQALFNRLHNTWAHGLGSVPYI